MESARAYERLVPVLWPVEHARAEGPYAEVVSFGGRAFARAEQGPWRLVVDVEPDGLVELQD